MTPVTETKFHERGRPVTVKNTIIVEKFTVNKTSKAAEQLKEIAGVINKRGTKVAGVKARPATLPEPTRILQDDSERWRYTGKIQLVKEVYKSEEQAAKYIGIAERYLRKACEVRGWRVVGDSVDIQEREAAAAERPPFIVPDITDEDIKRELPGIYMRDSHIKIIHLSAKMGAKTKMKKRTHILLWGQPAAAKTVLYQGLKKMYEKNDGCERVQMLDATTVTKAGLENWLISKSKEGTLPEILCLEEIEKYQPENMLCLLSLMDSRGAIQKTNAKIGSIIAKTPVIIWATCNDESILKTFHKGALWSRFSRKLKCVRPNREVMTNIMLDKIRSWVELGVEMSEECAKIAVDYAFDIQRTNDPREIEALLDGGNLLLDGTYFKYLDEIAKQAEEDAALKLENSNNV